ncbi:unnamed protein product [Brachionus calyciflorus]|uniref:Reverse transcriptase domain-containing protein n=1 Tax=Brachionus calyciflorus TaxID=104777 RepID=A0A814LDJ8_9BILA|nr:unnamed protein product [Brachionus calyciflorus]
MERLLRDEILVYLIKNKLINPRQHGFLPKRSFYTDFSKAFDKVSHRKLLRKLKAFRIHGKTLELIRSFLIGRKQRVVLGEAVSDCGDVTSGVIQGSVLGPLLFVMYINDLFDSLNGFSLSYADDLKMMGSWKSPINKSEELQKDLDILMEWSKMWSAYLNFSKCKSMSIGHQNINDYSINDKDENTIHILQKTDQEKDLGIYITNNLKWRKQCTIAAAKANRALGQIKNSKFLDIFST